MESFKNFVADLVYAHVNEENKFVGNSLDEMLESINEQFLKIDISKEGLNSKNIDEVIEYIYGRLVDEYEQKIKEVPEEITREFEKAIALRVIDMHWMEHINTMSHLREGIHLRGYAQENPLRAYTKEGYDLFDQLLMTIDRETTVYLMKAEIRQNVERKQVIKGEAVTDKTKEKKSTPKRVNKVGRNELCPCGSGKKYKQCCGK